MRGVGIELGIGFVYAISCSISVRNKDKGSFLIPKARMRLHLNSVASSVPRSLLAPSASVTNRIECK